MKIQIFRGARKYIPPDYACIFAGEILPPGTGASATRGVIFRKKDHEAGMSEWENSKAIPAAGLTI